MTLTMLMKIPRGGTNAPNSSSHRSLMTRLIATDWPIPDPTAAPRAALRCETEQDGSQAAHHAAAMVVPGTIRRKRPPQSPVQQPAAPNPSSHEAQATAAMSRP